MANFSGKEETDMELVMRKGSSLGLVLMAIAAGILAEFKSFALAPFMFAKSLAVREDGNTINTSGFVLIAVGFVMIVFALNFLSIVYSTAATNGSSANIGSFTGTRNLSDQIPLVVTAVVLLLGVGMLGLGGYVIARSVKMGA